MSGAAELGAEVEPVVPPTQPPAQGALHTSHLILPAVPEVLEPPADRVTRECPVLVTLQGEGGLVYGWGKGKK